MVWIRGECCKCPQVWIQPQYATLTAIDAGSGATLWWEDRSQSGNALVSSSYCAASLYGMAEAGGQVSSPSFPANTSLRVFDGERSPTADVSTGTASTIDSRWVGADPLTDLFCYSHSETGIPWSDVYFVDSAGDSVHTETGVSIDESVYFMGLLDGRLYFIEDSTSKLITLDTSGTKTEIVDTEVVWFVRRVGNSIAYIKSQDDGGTDYITVVVRDTSGSETQYQSSIDASTVSSAQIGVPGPSFFSVHVNTTSYTVWSFDSTDVASGPVVTASSLVTVNESMAMETTGDLVILDVRRLLRYDTGGLVWNETSTTLFGDNYNIFDIDQFGGDILAIGQVGFAGDTFLARMQVDKAIDWQVGAPKSPGNVGAGEIIVDLDRDILLLPHERVDK